MAPPAFLDVRFLRRAGRLLFGDRWQTQVAQALNVALRTVQRWDAETSQVPASVADELIVLLRERATEIKAFLAQKH